MRSPWAVLACCLRLVAAYETGTVAEISSFSIPASPSGMFFYETQGLLYILCGTQTNGDHYLYVYTTGGEQKCYITIPQSVGMSRVDGFYIKDSTAYIVDSQGPIYAGNSNFPNALGGSVYAVEWSNPCSCDNAGGATCVESTVQWSPTVTATYTLDAAASDIGDGGGSDDYYRNSGIVVSGDYFYAVNGVHPNPGLTCCYPKSLIKYSMTDSSVASKWSFTASTIGHDVDMEGITCGADACASYLYVGDEYNYIYKLNLATSDEATAVETQWDLNSIVGNVPDDKGIESLTYASTTGYFYAGIQETATIHVVQLSNSASDATTTTVSGEVSGDATTTTVSGDTTTVSGDTTTVSGDVSGAPERMTLLPAVIFLPALLLRQGAPA